MHRHLTFGLVLLLQVSRPASAPASGSGLNVAVVVNQRSADSVRLGNYYCERRQVPPQNLVRLTNWAGGNVAWSRAQCESCLLNPLLEALSVRGLSNQIDFVLLSMDIPYRVTATNGVNSTTAMLFYGFKADTDSPVPNIPSCSLPPESANSYALSEGIFRVAPPASAPTQAFLAMMLTASNLTQARHMVDQGVASDGTCPAQTVWLAKTTDVFRNVRYLLFDDALFDARLRGNYSLLRTNANSPFGLTNLLGYQTGLAQFDISPDAFVPGAMADSLTSYAGVLFEPNGQTSLLGFLNAGAAASYGTVVEPCNYLEKFPSPRNYFYQARGFSLAECYYLSLKNPHQGLLVGEPLAAPFARPPCGDWDALPAGARLAGTTNLSLHFSAGSPGAPVQQVDLFLDGIYLRTLTNIPPAESNLLSVTISGYTLNHRVPSNATIQTVTSGLADQLNAITNLTKVAATAYGDRIQLQSQDLARAGDQIPITASSLAGGASALTTFVAPSRTSFLDTVAFAVTHLAVSNSPLVGDWVQLDILKTNGDGVTLTATNAAANGTVSQLVQSLVNQVNASQALQSPDGVVAGDYVGYDSFGLPLAEFSLQARAAGPGPSRIQAILSGSPRFWMLPDATNRLDFNLGDLQPRNHLYVTAGVTNLAFTFPLDTTPLADGFHELTAVAYEGSHVRTQARVTQTAWVKNTPLVAAFTCLVGDTNTALEATLQFSVVANTNAIARIELFTTGGSVGVVSNQAVATFPVAGTNLGLGLHPFTALVTGTRGAQYRTETKWIRLVGAESPIPLALTWPPPTLAWPAIAGRRYEVLSTDALTNAFQLRGSVTPTNDAGRWTDTSPSASNRFYRVRTAP